jgi:drug/metabolite transporter (DMT)-like permease
MSASRPVTVIALVGAMVLWASSFIALKYAFMSYDPMIVIFARMAIALLFVLLFFSHVFRGLDITRSDLKYLSLMALFEPCLYFIFEAEALLNTTASQAGMITALLPVMVAIGAWLWIGEQITRRIVIGGLLAFAGAVWLSLGGEASSYAPHPLYGNLMEFLAMVMAVGYTLTLKHLSKRFKPLFLTAFQALIGTLFFLPFLFLKSVTIPAVFPLLPSLSVLYLGVAVSFGAYGLYNYGVSSIPASEAVLYINLIPVFAVILAYLLLNEKFGLSEVLGGMVILLGVWIAQSKAAVVVADPETPKGV